MCFPKHWSILTPKFHIVTRAQHFPSNFYPYPDHNHQQQPMPNHAQPCPPMLFKLCPCFQKLCNVYYPSTPSLGWIGQIKDRSLSLASARSVAWLAYSLHPRNLTPIWNWMQGCTKLMPTHAHPKPMGTQCRALIVTYISHMLQFECSKTRKCQKAREAHLKCECELHVSNFW